MSVKHQTLTFVISFIEKEIRVGFKANLIVHDELRIMELTKHNQDLANRLQLLDIKADNQLAKELMELHQKKCMQCQKDRLSCTVRPSCRNRNFLNMLIDIGVEPQDLPSFCYTQYMDQLKRFILEKKGRGMKNRRLLIKDMLSTLKVSSIRHFVTKFKKVWKTTTRVGGEEDILLVAGDDLIFQFDFSRGIVILNPDNFQIDSYSVLKLYFELFSEYYNVKTTVFDVTTNWWTISIETSIAISNADASSLKSKFAGRFESISVDVSKNPSIVNLEVIDNGSKSTLEVGHVRDLFKIIDGFKEK
ncbi:MAG: hypothetical protein ACTSU3_01010 [Candidatus Thorarchaeota archaeon]